MIAPVRQHLSLAVPLVVLVVTIVSVPVMVLGPNGLPRHRRLTAQIEAQQQENTRLTRELLSVRAELNAFATDPRARERAVRESIGWVRPDEVVVEVPSQPAARP